MLAVQRIGIRNGVLRNGIISKANALQQYNGFGLYRLSTGYEHKGDQDSKKDGFLKGLTGAAIVGVGVWSIGKMLDHEKVQKNEMAKSGSGFNLRNIIGLKKLTGCFIGDDNESRRPFFGSLINELKKVGGKLLSGAYCMDEQPPPPPPFQLIRNQYPGILDYDSEAKETLMRYSVKRRSAFARLEVLEHHAARIMISKMFYYSIPDDITLDYIMALIIEMNHWFADHGMHGMTEPQMIDLARHFMREFNGHGEIEHIMEHIRNKQQHPEEFDPLPPAFGLSFNRYPAEVDFELIVENLQQDFQVLLLMTPSFIALNQLIPTLNLAELFMTAFVVYKMSTNLTREYFVAIIMKVNEDLIERRLPFFGADSMQVIANFLVQDLAQGGPLFMLLSSIQTVQNHPHRFLLPDHLYPLFNFEDFVQTEAEVINAMEIGNQIHQSDGIKELDNRFMGGLNGFVTIMARYAVPDVTGMQYVLFLVQKFHQEVINQGGRRMSDIEIIKVLDTFWWELYEERGFYNLAHGLRRIQNPVSPNLNDW